MLVVVPIAVTSCYVEVDKIKHVREVAIVVRIIAPTSSIVYAPYVVMVIVIGQLT